MFQVSMSTVENESLLLEVPPDEVPQLLATLKKDIPRSLHAYSFISTMLKWSTSDPTTYDFHILAPQGDYKEEAIFYYFIGFGGRHHISVHVWSEKGASAMAEALSKSKIIDWEDKSIMLLALCMTMESAALLYPYTTLKNELLWEASVDTAYWMPADKAKDLTIEVPIGYRLSPVTEEHVDFINEHWPHKFDGSKELVRANITLNFGFGVFEEKTGSLCAWALRTFYGGIGHVATTENHRRHGLATVATLAVAKEMAHRGVDPHLNVCGGNVAGEKLFEKMNFKLAFKSVWIFTVDGWE